MNSRFPVFVPTKGRYKTPYTIKEFERIGVKYTAVVESQEAELYKPIVKNGAMLILPHQNKGLTVTRNWIWDYAQHELKTPYFWTFDDNIRGFYRLHKNMKYKIDGAGFLEAIEDFVMRYNNLIIGGMNYEMFVPRRRAKPPLTLNTRIYSNMFIQTDAPYRNVTFYNDDTDLCLRVLKDGNCTVLFNAFLADKIATMTVKGGMTDFYEQTDNRKQFAVELMRAHPGIVRVVKKFGRWHHQVNYKPFKNNKLVLRDDAVIPTEPNEYGMKLVRRGE